MPEAQRTLYLRNRKHVLCFYRVIQTRVEVWENEKCCGNTSGRRVIPQLFRVVPNFHECLYNSIETRSTCFLFLLENNARRKRKTTCQLSLSKCKFSLFTSSLRQQAGSGELIYVTAVSRSILKIISTRTLGTTINTKNKTGSKKSERPLYSSFPSHRTPLLCFALYHA